jgi:hypothetical protein
VPERLPTRPDPRDRPGWIPAHIERDWDPDPYAYRTEEEPVPAGGPHGLILVAVMNPLQGPLEARGLMLLQDLFLIYRDPDGRRQRIAPDLLLMPWRAQVPSAYDLDLEPPRQRAPGESARCRASRA